MSQDYKKGNHRRGAPEIVSDFLVALGSNEGSVTGGPEKTLEAALQYLAENGLVIRASSRIYRTPAYPAGSGPDFANAVCRCTAGSLDAHAVLKLLHGAEVTFGRERRVRWGPRTLDLDLLAAGSEVLPDEKTLKHWMGLPAELQSQTEPKELLLPHPRLHERAFVLVPLAEVAPDWVHPILGQSATALLDALPGYLRDEVVPYAA